MSYSGNISPPDPIADRIVLSCARLVPKAADLDFLRTLGHTLDKESINWLSVITIAEKNGVLPLLYLNLQKSRNSAVPASIMQTLMVRNVEYCRTTARLVDTAKNLSDSLRTQGVTAVLFKGQEQGLRYYGDVNLRQCTDLSMWIRESDIRTVQSVLQSNGFEPHPWRNQPVDHQFFKSDLFPKLCHQYIYVKEPQKIYVELHWRAPLSPLLAASEQDLMSQAVQRDLWDSSVAVFSDELSLILACVGGCSRAWARLRSIVDVGEIITNANINWKAVFEMSRRFSVEKMVASGLCLAQALLDYSLPPEAEQFVKTTAIPAGSLEILEQCQSNLVRRNWNDLKKWTYYLSLRKNQVDSAKLLFQLCTIPTMDEWQRFSLPLSVFPLYYCARPLGLLIAQAPWVGIRYLKGGYDKQLNITDTETDQ